MILMNQQHSEWVKKKLQIEPDRVEIPQITWNPIEYLTTYNTYPNKSKGKMKWSIEYHSELVMYLRMINTSTATKTRNEDYSAACIM